MSAKVDVLKGLIKQTAYLYSLDLRALPEGKFETSPGGVARTPQDISSEVAGFNRLCCALLTDQPAAESGGMVADAAAAEVAVKESSEALLATIDSLDEDALQAKVTAPWGQEMTKFDLAQMAAINTVYHDGQLNYFQALHGDGEIHWK